MPLLGRRKSHPSLQEMSDIRGGALSTSEVSCALTGLSGAHWRRGTCISSAHLHLKELGETEVKLAQGVDRVQLQRQAQSCSFQALLGWGGGISPLASPPSLWPVLKQLCRVMHQKREEERDVHPCGSLSAAPKK